MRKTRESQGDKEARMRGRQGKMRATAEACVTHRLSETGSDSERWTREAASFLATPASPTSLGSISRST